MIRFTEANQNLSVFLIRMLILTVVAVADC